jgi:hypothetical protein
MCGGCVADMPRWCDRHLRKTPQQWMRSVAFRGDEHLCDECLKKETDKLKPPPMPITPPPPPPEKKPVEEPEEEVKLEVKTEEEIMAGAKVCACGCGESLAPGSKWKYLRGHKPKLAGQVLERVHPEVPPPGGRPSLKGNYGPILEELRAKRDKLNAAIEAIEQLG